MKRYGAFGRVILALLAGALAGPVHAALVAEMEPNDSFDAAQDVTAGFSNNPDPNITFDDNLTIEGTGDGSHDYYRIELDSFYQVEFDIDGASFDTELFVFADDAARSLVAFNDDNSSDASARTDTELNSRAAVTLQPGGYVIAVARFPSSADDGGIVSGAVPESGSYVLHISRLARPQNSSYTIDGTAFNLRDVRAGGTSVALFDDDVSAEIPLPFTFSFFELDYDSLRIASNGFLFFPSAELNNGCCSGQSIPDSNGPNNLIAGYWEDLNPAAQGTINYQVLGSAPHREFVVGFYEVPHFGGGPLLSFEMILHEGSNNIELQYASASSDGGTHTVGIENRDGSDAVLIALGDVSFSNQGFLIRPVPELSITDASIVEGDAGASLLEFTVSLSAVSATEVSFDAETNDGSALAGSDYTAIKLAGVTIPAGDISTTVSVEINGDTVFEDDETFIVLLSNPVAATIADDMGEGIILNDDAAPDGRIIADSRRVNEGDSTTVRVELDEAAGVDIVIDLILSGTATRNTDYSIADSIIVPAGATVGSTVLSAVADGVSERSLETIQIDSDRAGSARVSIRNQR